jgi:hypothetical protein
MSARRSERQRDRAVRRLTARQHGDEPLPDWGEVFLLCPFQSLLAPPALNANLSKADLGAVMTCVAVLEHAPPFRGYGVSLIESGVFEAVVHEVTISDALNAATGFRRSPIGAAEALARFDIDELRRLIALLVDRSGEWRMVRGTRFAPEPEVVS